MEWLMPTALTAKKSEMREVDMAWVDHLIFEPRMTRMTRKVLGLSAWVVACGAYREKERKTRS